MKKNKNFFAQPWVQLSGALGVLVVVVAAVLTSSGTLFKGESLNPAAPMWNRSDTGMFVPGDITVVSPSCLKIEASQLAGNTPNNNLTAKVTFSDGKDYSTEVRWEVLRGQGNFSPVSDDTHSSANNFDTTFTSTTTSSVRAYVAGVASPAVMSDACTSGSVVTVQYTTPNPPAMVAPTLVFPSNGASYTAYNPDVNFTWNAVSWAKKYDLLVKFGGMADYRVYPVISTATAIAALPPPSNYSVKSSDFPALTTNYIHKWKVRAYNADGGYKDSEEWLFYVYKATSNPPGTNLTAPYITSPTEGAVLNNFPRYAYIQWTAVTGANQYQIEVGCDICASKTSLWLNPTTNLSSSNGYVTTALAGDNKFRTRVRAMDYSGNYGPWSDYRSFSYSTGNTPNGANVQILGSGSTDSSITLNLSNLNLSNPQQYFASCYLTGNESDFKVAYMSQPTGQGLNSVNITIGSLKAATKYNCQAGVATPASLPGQYSIARNSGNLDVTTQPGPVVQQPGGCTYFTDIGANNPYYNATNYVRNHGIFAGYADCSFKPYNPVNRAEAMKVLITGFGKSPMTGLMSNFSDVYTGQWFYDYVLTAQKLGYVQGYPDGMFKPGNTMNRAEMLKIFINASKYVSEVYGAKIQSGLCPDVTNYGEWYLPYFQVARNHGLIDGGYCKPNDKATRGAMADMFYRLK